MLDRRDPEFPSLAAETHWRLDREYLAGTIGEATYLRSLFLIGVRDDEARQALRACNEVKVRCAETERLAASRRWMEEYRAR